MNSGIKESSMKACVMMAGCAILLPFTLTAMPDSPSLAGQEGTSSKAKPKADPEKEKGIKLLNALSIIDQMLKRGEDREAIAEWERTLAEVPHVSIDEAFAWSLAQAYLRLGQHEKAITVYKPHYHIVTESVEQRVELGEILLFGSVGARPTTKEDYPIGHGQCHLCHRIFKETIKDDLEHDPFQPYLFNFALRIKELIKSPKYQKRSKNTIQPEAFPGSGIATSVIEYLAESNVCPSCYIATRVGFKDDDRDSIMPAVHKPPISLTVDEMVAIDTWLLKNEGEKIPSVKAMRAAYEKFLRPQDRRGLHEGVKLASLYDAKGDLKESVRLLDEVMLATPGYTPTFLKPEMFRNLKQHPDIISRFPTLFQTDSRPAN